MINNKKYLQINNACFLNYFNLKYSLCSGIAYSLRFIPVMCKRSRGQNLVFHTRQIARLARTLPMLEYNFLQVHNIPQAGRRAGNGTSDSPRNLPIAGRRQTAPLETMAQRQQHHRGFRHQRCAGLGILYREIERRDTEDYHYTGGYARS